MDVKSSPWAVGWGVGIGIPRGRFAGPIRRSGRLGVATREDAEGCGTVFINLIASSPTLEILAIALS